MCSSERDVKATYLVCNDCPIAQLGLGATTLDVFHAGLQQRRGRSMRAVTKARDDKRSRATDHRVEATRRSAQRELYDETAIWRDVVLHEIRNLSTTALLTLSAASDQPNGADVHSYNCLTLLLTSIQELSLSRSQPSEPVSEPLRLGEVLDDVLKMIGPRLKEVGARVNLSIPRQHAVRAGKRSLVQIVINILLNACTALSNCSGRELLIRSRRIRKRVCVTFSNSGDRIKYPNDLFSLVNTRPEGSGLGLYICRTLARSFRGDITYEYVDGKCCFHLLLPAVDARSIASTTPAKP